jgi:phosphoribosylformylglycinamidine cyclo-ligase
MAQREHTYEAAGVDRDVAEDAVGRIVALAAATQGPQVVGGPAGFGAMYRLSGYRDPVLVSSTDGVGTKVKVAVAVGRFEGLGEDVVNACVNDVIVSGARPLYFLDYIAMASLDASVTEALARGMARACRESECALIGGETAEMPGLYHGRDFDLAGFAVGAVESEEVLDPGGVREGDLLVGLPSSGLHTNGYSLVRHALGLDRDPAPLNDFHAELGQTLGEALLIPHRAYYPVVRGVLTHVKSMAHITGGGLEENVPRALPEGLGARFDAAAWTVPPIFTVLGEMTSVSREEMYRVFNMGLGLVLVCDSAGAQAVQSRLDEAMVVGEVVRAEGERRVAL